MFEWQITTINYGFAHDEAVICRWVFPPLVQCLLVTGVVSVHRQRVDHLTHTVWIRIMGPALLNTYSLTVPQITCYTMLHTVNKHTHTHLKAPRALGAPREPPVCKTKEILY